MDGAEPGPGITDAVHQGPVADRGVQAADGGSRERVRLYASPAGQPRFRRATDVLILAPALIGLALLIVAYPPSALELSLEAFLASFPGWLDPLWGFLFDLLWLWAIALLLLAALSRRLAVVLEALGAALLAIAVAFTAARLAAGDWPSLGAVIPGDSVAPAFPAVPMAEAVAVILTIAPHLVRPLQTTGRWLIVLGVGGAFVTGPASPFGTLAGFLAAVVAAVGVRLLLRHVGRPARPLLHRLGAARARRGRRRAHRRGAAGRRGPGPAGSRPERPPASGQGLRTRRVRHPPAREALAPRLVPGRRPAAQAEPEPGGGARGVRDAARPQRRRPDARGGDRRRHRRR